MPQTRLVTDAFGVVTISLVSLFTLISLLCIAYTIYFRSRVHSQSYTKLSYFNGPWIIRIIFILLSIFWGCGEILRLSLLRREGQVLNALNLKWQETVCKAYIVSNMGISEPCLLLILTFLLRAPLQRIDSGTLNKKWNSKTTKYVFLFCLPVFILQLVVILIGPQLSNSKGSLKKLPLYFTRTIVNSEDISFCAFPLLSTILSGLFVCVLTAYLFFIGRRILKLVINKGLHMRLYALIFSVTTFFPLRVIFLGLSVLSEPEHFVFEALVFFAFLTLLCCIGVCIIVLVYFPVANSLALGKNLQDIEATRRRITDDNDEAISLTANQSYIEESAGPSTGRISDASTKRGSISFRTMARDQTSGGTFVELSLFSPSRDETPQGGYWPMCIPSSQVQVS
ncbi:hypothetical protein ACFE04_003664 [Oxalis oulophora]